MEFVLEPWHWFVLGVLLMLSELLLPAFAALWFGETLATLQLMGCVMIFLALLVNRWQMLRSIITRRGL